MLRLICVLLLTASIAANDVHEENDWNLRHLVEEEAYGPIVSTDYPSFANSTDVTNACIKVQDGNVTEGQTLVLGDCEQGMDDGWRLDKSKMFRSQLDDGMCIQAGRGNSPSDGNVLRLFTCDGSRKSQKFIYAPGIGIRPYFSQQLCVVWQGVLPQIDSDPILVNTYQDVGGRIRCQFDM